jgi:hypothetical protein
MYVLGHINLEEMLGDLTVTTFVILLAASIAVVSLMVLFSLIALAFEKKVKPTKDARAWDHDTLTAHDELWQTRRPWLALRSDFLRPDAVTHSQLMSDPTTKCAGVGTLRLFSSLGAAAPNHTTPLIKRTNTATQMDRNLIMPIKESDGEMIQQSATPPNPVETILQRPRAA